MAGIDSGKGWKLPLITVFDIYMIFIITSLPGLAISPIMGKLAHIFTGTSHLEIQMIYLAPNLAAIPFIFIGGAMAMKYNKLRLVNICCLIYAICGALFFFIDPHWSFGMVLMIALSLIIGVCGGILSPLSVTIITDCFAGKKRSLQFGLTGAMLNIILMGCTIATGYLAVINWKLPFMFYLLPVVPLFLAWTLRKYIPEAKDIDKARHDAGADKKKFKFSDECHVGSLFRYCSFYFFVTLILSSISLYVPFLVSSSTTAGYLTSMLFLGIFASGIILNWLLKVFRHGTFIWIIALMALGYVLIVITKAPFIIGVGVIVAAFFYGIAQPYCYTLVSDCATPKAVPMAQSFLISMDSIGVVLAPFIIDGIADLFKKPTATHPLEPFIMCLIGAVAGTVAIIIYKLWRREHPVKLRPFPEEAMAASAAIDKRQAANAATDKVNAKSK